MEINIMMQCWAFHKCFFFHWFLIVIHEKMSCVSAEVKGKSLKSKNTTTNKRNQGDRIPYQQKSELLIEHGPLRAFSNHTILGKLSKKCKPIQVSNGVIPLLTLNLILLLSLFPSPNLPLIERLTRILIFFFLFSIRKNEFGIYASCIFYPILLLFLH